MKHILSNTWTLVILGFVIAGMLKDLVYVIARKFVKPVLLTIWEMFGPRPGGKLWAVSQMLKGE